MHPLLKLALTVPVWQLIFALSRDDIGTTIMATENLLETEPFDDALRVRFVVPLDATTTAQWGTCSGAAGTVTFDDLGNVPGSELRATFSMTLTDCVEPIDEAPILVTGAFDLTLTESFDAICP